MHLNVRMCRPDYGGFANIEQSACIEGRDRAAMCTYINMCVSKARVRAPLCIKQRMHVLECRAKAAISTVFKFPYQKPGSRRNVHIKINVSEGQVKAVICIYIEMSVSEGRVGAALSI